MIYKRLWRGRSLDYMLSKPFVLHPPLVRTHTSTAPDHDDVPSWIHYLRKNSAADGISLLWTARLDERICKHHGALWTCLLLYRIVERDRTCHFAAKKYLWFGAATRRTGAHFCFVSSFVITEQLLLTFFLSFLLLTPYHYAQWKPACLCEAALTNLLRNLKIKW